MVVLRVDKEKGYIDLFKCCVLLDDVMKCEECYNKFKVVYMIMLYIVGKLNKLIESLYELIVWFLDKKYGYVYDVFKIVVVELNLVFDEMIIDLEVFKEL